MAPHDEEPPVTLLPTLPPFIPDSLSPHAVSMGSDLGPTWLSTSLMYPRLSFGCWAACRGVKGVKGINARHLEAGQPAGGGGCQSGGMHARTNYIIRPCTLTTAEASLQSARSRMQPRMPEWGMMTHRKLSPPPNGLVGGLCFVAWPWMAERKLRPRALVNVALRIPTPVARRANCIYCQRTRDIPEYIGSNYIWPDNWVSKYYEAHHPDIPELS